MAKNLLRRYKTQADYNAVKCELGEDIVGAIIENEDVKYGGETQSFIAVYDVTSTTSATTIFGSGFSINQIDRMYIDGVEVTPTSAYTFSTTGEHKVKCDVCGIDNCNSMFHNCKQLTSLDLSDFDTSNVTDMNRMFYYCTNLTSLNVTNFDTSNVTDMGYMFYNCKQLTSLYLSNFNTYNVTNMSNMFGQCTSLTSLDVSSFDTSKVTDMNHMFYYCTNLTSLNVNNFNTSNVTSMGSMFSVCESLQSLDVSNFNTSNVTNMGSMFSNCHVLTSLDVSSFDTSKVTDMTYMFNFCQTLTSLDVSNFDTSKVTSMSTMFNGCSKLTSLDLNSFDTTNVKNMYFMFNDCTRLSSISLNNWNTSNVTNMGNMFNNCNIISLDLSNWDVSKVTNMSYMFRVCDNLTSIKMLGNISNVKSYTEMFYGTRTTGQLTINCDYEEAWNNILVTNQSISNFPSTWSFKCSSCQPSGSFTDLIVTSSNVAKCSTSGSFTVKANGSYTDAECNTSTISVTLSSSSYTVKYGTSSGSYTLDSITENNTTNAKTWYYKITTSSDYNSLTKTGSFTQEAGPCSCTTSTTTTYSSYVVSYNGGAVACNVTSVTPTVTATKLITTINSDCTTTTSSTSNYAITDYTVSYSPSGNNNGTTNRTITATVKHNGSNVGTFTYTQNSGATCYSTTDVTGTTYELKVLSTSIGKCDTTASPTVQGRSGVTHTTGATVWGSWTNLTKDTHYTITIPTITTNETSSSKTYNVTVSGKGVYAGKTASGTITQAAGPCYIMQKTSSDSSTAITFPGGITYMNYQGYICCYSVKDGVKQPVTISTDVSWLSCYENNDLPYDGANYNFRFDPQTNTSTSSRTGHITLTQSGSGKQVVWTIVQEGKPITYSYSATAENFDDCATSTTVKVYEKASTASTWTNITSEITPTIKYKTNSTTYSTSATKNSGSTSVVWDVQISFTRRDSSQSLVVNATQDAGPCPDLCSCSVTSIVVIPSEYIFSDANENKTFNVTITDNGCVNCNGGFKVYDSNDLEVENGTNSFSLLNQSGTFTIKANDDISKICTLKTTEYTENYIVATFNVTSTTSNTRIVGSGFTTSTISKMYIDDVESTVKTGHTFTSTGNHTVKYVYNNTLEKCNVMFDYCTNLVGVDFSNFNSSKITSTYAMFRDCSGLTSLDMSDFDTSNVTDMSRMFSGCTKLTSLDVSNFNTSKATSMSYMFYNCSGLTSLDVSNFDTSKVTQLWGTFYNCRSLTSLDVSKWNTSKATTMHHMFNSCSGLTSLNVSNFDTSKVTSMASMFSSCSNLTSLNISNFNTSNVTDMSHMFSYCSKLASLSLGNFNTSNVENMEWMFNSCSNLTSLDVSDFDTSNVTNMNGMFSYCSKLTSLDLSSFDTSNVTDIESMFSFASGLTSLDINHFNISKVTSLSSVFHNCSNLTSLNLSDWDVTKVASLNSTFYGCKKLNSIKMLGNISKVTTQYTNTFSGITTSGSLTINCDYEDAWNSIIVTNKSKSKFPSTWSVNCYAENNVTATYNVTSTSSSVQLLGSGFDILQLNEMYVDGTKVTNTKTYRFSSSGTHTVKYNFFGGLDSCELMFENCKQLKTLDLSEFDASNVTNMSFMFSNCTSLTSIDFGSIDTSNVEDMCNMFYMCGSLTTLDLSNFDTSNVVGMTSMFQDCGKLKTLNLSSFDTSNVDNMSFMFQNCSGLTSLDLNHFDTRNVYDMSFMFYNCTNLRNVNMGDCSMISLQNTQYMFANTACINIRIYGNYSTILNSEWMFLSLPAGGTLVYNCAWENNIERLTMDGNNTGFDSNSWYITCL